MNGRLALLLLLFSHHTQAQDAPGNGLPARALLRIGSANFLHAQPITALAFSPDGKSLASASRDGTIRLWNTGGQQRLSFTFTAVALAFSPDGRTIAAVNDAGQVLIGNASTGQSRSWKIEPAVPLLCLAFSPDGKTLATAGQGDARLWDVTSGKEIAILKVVESETTSIAFSPDGKTIATASRSLALWNSSGVCLRRTGRDCPATVVAFAPDGKTLAAGRIDGVLLLLNPDDLSEFASVDAHKRYMTNLAFGPDGRTLLSAGIDLSLRLWDVPGKRQKWVKENALGDTLAAAFSGDGRTIAVEGPGHHVTLIDAATGKPLPEPPGRLPPVASLDCSPDGRLLAVGYEDGTLRLWDSTTDKEVRSLGERDRGAVCVRFMTDGKTIAWGSPEQPLRISDFSGKTIRAFKTGSAGPLALAIGDEGTLLAAGYLEPSVRKGAIHVWNISSDRPIYTLPISRHGLRHLTLSPDGSKLAALSGLGTATVWNLENGEARSWEVDGQRGGALAFSQRGTRLAVSQGKDIVHLVYPISGEVSEKMTGASEGTNGLAFSTDGRLLAAAGVDGSVRLWEIISEQQVLRLEGGHIGAVRSVVFLPDLRRIASAGTDGTTVVWDFTGHQQKQAEMLTTRDFDTIWRRLASDDASAAYQDVWRLARSSEGMAFLNEALRHLIGVERAEVEKLIGRLENTRFHEREYARQILERLESATEPALRAALEGKPTLEMRRSIEELLNRLEKGPTTRARKMRLFRAFQAIEYAGTPEAKTLLALLRDRATHPSVRHEARNILERMK
jgi:WD40 repeat protein